MRNGTYFKIIAFLSTLSSIVFEVTADICSSGESCERCCGSRCCYDDETIHRSHDHGHGYSYRVSFYNLWYFWFVILFVLMSCFGGCGYYKQRQRFARARGMTTQLARPVRTTLPRGRAIITTVDPSAHSNFGYAQTADDSGMIMQPPPYAEVMMQPHLYPAQKLEPGLPPYPGQHVIVPARTTGIPPSAVSPVSEIIPQPPPYSLFDASNQNADNSQATANQTRDGSGTMASSGTAGNLQENQT